MNLKFLETFVWVAKLKSYRLTAEKLFTTQTKVSRNFKFMGSTFLMHGSVFISWTQRVANAKNRAVSR